MLEFVVPTIQTSFIDFLTCLAHRHYHRPTEDAALTVESEKGKLEIFTELNPWFLIHALAEETIICNIDALSNWFNKTLIDILDKFKTRTMINRPKVSWFNDDIKQLKRQRRRLEKKAVKTDLPGDWNNYHKVRNQNSAFLKSARVNYYSNLIDQCAGDSRKSFRVVNSLCREPLETALPEHTDPTKLANEFGTFFLKKIEIIKENLDKFLV